MKCAKLLVVAAFVLLVGARSASAEIVQIWSATFTGSGACGNFDGGSIKTPVFVAIFEETGVVVSLDSKFTQVLGALGFFAVYELSATSGAFSSFAEDTGFIEIANGTFKMGKTGNIAGFASTFQGIDEGGCFFGGALKSGKLLLTETL
jgi:hypothetical protein